MEHIGMSWVKHGFYALSMDACDLWPGDNCGDPTNGTELGVGCSDPYSASLNGVQSNMSLRSDVNAYTGYFPYPWTAPGYSNVIHRRLQVHDVDLDTELNEGALYFVQGHYVTADDAAAGNHFNNASYRPVTVTFTPPDIYNLYVIGETQREQPAIRAWQDTDPTVTETDVVVPNEGLFIVASQATDLGGGMWHYEYAVQNLNSDRSARLFSVPLPPHAVVENIGYHDVDYHSGEPYDQSGWQPTLADNSLSWSTYTFDVLEDANALRFGSLYNFRFDADVSPALLAVRPVFSNRRSDGTGAGDRETGRRKRTRGAAVRG